MKKKNQKDLADFGHRKMTLNCAIFDLPSQINPKTKKNCMAVFIELWPSLLTHH